MKHVEMLDFSKRYRQHKFEKFTISNGDFDLMQAKLTEIITNDTRKTIEGILGRPLVDYYNTHMHASRDMMNKKLRDMFKAQVPFASITIGRDTLFEGVLDNGYSTSVEGSANSLSMNLLTVMSLDEENGVVFYNQREDRNFGIKVGLSSVVSSFQVLAMVESRQIAYHLAKSWEFKNRVGYRYDLIKDVKKLDDGTMEEISYELPCVIPYVIVKNFCDVMGVDYSKPSEVIREINHYSSSNIYLRTDASVDKPVYMFNYPVNLNVRYETNDYNDFSADGLLVNKAAVRRNIIVQYLVPTFFKFTTPIATLDLDAKPNYVEPSPKDYKVPVPTYDIKPTIDEHFSRVDKIDFRYEDSDLESNKGVINLHDIIRAAYLDDYIKYCMKTRETKLYSDFIKFDYVTCDERDVQNADSESCDINYSDMKLYDMKAKKGLKCHVFVYIDTVHYKKYQIETGLAERNADVEVSTL